MNDYVCIGLTTFTEMWFVILKASNSAPAVCHTYLFQIPSCLVTQGSVEMCQGGVAWVQTYGSCEVLNGRRI